MADGEEHFRALLAERDAGGGVRSRIVSRTIADLPPGDVLIRVHFSSLNYKDALVCAGHPGIAREYPLVPGIDVAGEVVAGGLGDIGVGREVLVTGFGLGVSISGGFAEFIRVPGSWVLPLPEGLSLKESMSLGTAGLTAALCVDRMRAHGLKPEDGPVLVTGATGGVGGFASALLARLGYTVAAVTRRSALESYFEALGVSRVVAPDALASADNRELGRGEWAAAVDTVGGEVLARVLKQIRYGGIVTACGMAAGPSLATSVYPFILRGVTLAGIDSVQCPMATRERLWRAWGGEWRLPLLESMVETIPLEEVPRVLTDLLAGKRRGRTVVALAGH